MIAHTNALQINTIFLNFLMSFSLSSRATAKLGVAGGAVYLTAREGLWGSSRETNEAYKRLKSKTLDEWLPASVEKPTASKKVGIH